MIRAPDGGEARPADESHADPAANAMITIPATVACGALETRFKPFAILIFTAAPFCLRVLNVVCSRPVAA